jgi:hypothetical protein
MMLKSLANVVYRNYIIICSWEDNFLYSCFLKGDEKYSADLIEGDFSWFYSCIKVFGEFQQGIFSLFSSGNHT